MLGGLVGGNVATTEAAQLAGRNAPPQGPAVALAILLAIFDQSRSFITSIAYTHVPIVAKSYWLVFYLVGLRAELLSLEVPAYEMQP